MKLIPTKIPEVKIVEPQVFADERGYFLESWNEAKLRQLGLELEFAQDSHSFSSQGVLRGLHYQLVRPQGKLVRVVSGCVFDVAVDLRRSSATYGQWVGSWLDADSKRMLWVPPGFAHGFYVASPSADFLYKCTALWAPEHERTIVWDDPDLAIEWPLVDGRPPRVSDKDLAGGRFVDAEVYD